MTHPNPSTALAETIVDELVALGVRLVVVCPGSRSAPLAISAARHDDVEVVVEIDERSAGFYALGVAKGSGLPAAVVVTSGTAVANLHPAVVEADASATPLLLLTADRPPERQDVGANQTIRQAHLFGDRVRWAATLGPAEDRSISPTMWRSMLDRAVAEALGWGSRPGPVHLDFAFREPLVPRTDDGRTVGEPYPSPTDGRDAGGPWTRPVIPPTPTTLLDRRWSEVERGLIVAGAGAAPVLGEANRLAAVLGWPLISEPTAGGRPPQSITTAHHLACSSVFADRYRPDVVMTVGSVGLSRPLTEMLAGVPRIATMGWNDPERSAVEVHPGFVTVAAPRHRSGSWRRDWLESEAVARAALDQAVDAQDRPSEPRAARDVGAVIADGGVLVAGSSTPIRDLDRYLPSGPFRIVSNRGASGIDGTVSTALGVARCGPTVALLGDLSLLHDLNGLLVRPRPPLVLVVVDNDGGGIFSYLPQAQETDVFEQVFGTPTGVDIGALASAHGMAVRSVADTGGIAEAVSELVERGGGIVHVPVERGPQVEIARRLTSAVVEAVEDGDQRRRGT